MKKAIKCGETAVMERFRSSPCIGEMKEVGLIQGVSVFGEPIKYMLCQCTTCKTIKVI